MSLEPTSGAPPQEPRLETFFDRVVALSASRDAADPDAFLRQVDALRAGLRLLEQQHPEVELRAHFEDFARHRFTLVDSGEEYAVAAEEVLMLSAVSSEAPQLCIRALQESVVALSSVLGEAGVVRQFGNLLRRLRQIARQTDDAELKAWLAGVAAALPGEPASEEQT